MKQILLTQGKVALVDDEDFEWLNQYKWRVEIGARTSYAKRGVDDPSKARRTTLAMHRLILGLTDSKTQVDHIDHNGLNNQRNNLRVVTKQQNAFNMRSFRGTSKHKGVSFYKPGGKWVARIVVNYIPIHLGYFEDEKEAARAYNKASLEHFGEYAYLNNLDTP